jgi:MOSC domain-containing protein YiiM|tara:strand:+ start:4125 stop:4610 length:486 start_codon:yes stop_codon:yes gene_type:complete
MKTSIFQINKKPETGREVGLPKTKIEKAEITFKGINGDYNRFRKKKKNNDPDMALMLLSTDVLEQLNLEGWPVEAGHLGENLTLTNINYNDIAPNQEYTIGSQVKIKISFICDPCSNLKALPYVGKSRKTEFIKTLMKRRGWYARVLKPGQLTIGDIVTKV